MNDLTVHIVEIGKENISSSAQGILTAVKREVALELILKGKKALLGRRVSGWVRENLGECHNVVTGVLVKLLDF